MANKTEITDRLLRRFKGVPSFDTEDAMDLVDEAFNLHGLKPSDSVPSDKEQLIMYYVQSQGAWQIALSVAHYFKFTDGEEAIDKTMLADNYRRLAKDFEAKYESEKSFLYGSNFRTMQRPDRPNTTPPSGESGRRSLWRRY